MEKTFLNYDKPILTTMIQAGDLQRIKNLMDMANQNGTEAFGVQFERLNPVYRNKMVYEEIFSYTDKPIYVTNYRSWENDKKSDDILTDELLELSECGATLCDVIGDLYDKQPDELAICDEAINKQMDLIDKLHCNGSEVLMSTHILKYTPAERVLEVALEHQRRGADISKIVTSAATIEQQIENLRIVNLLKNELKIPFLYLSSGECHILRRIGGELGCCMYLCVQEYDDYATPIQPLLNKMKAIRDNF